MYLAKVIPVNVKYLVLPRYLSGLNSLEGYYLFYTICKISITHSYAVSQQKLIAVTLWIIKMLFLCDILMATLKIA